MYSHSSQPAHLVSSAFIFYNIMHECIPTHQRGIIDFSLRCDEVMSNTTAAASACSCILCTETMNVNEVCSSRYHARLVDTHKSSQGQIPALTYCVSSCCQLTRDRLRSNSVSRFAAFSSCL